MSALYLISNVVQVSNYFGLWEWKSRLVIILHQVESRILITGS